MQNLNVVYLAKRPLIVGGDVIQPGELVDATDWLRRIIDTHINLEWITPMLVTDASRAEVTKQWEAEEAAREAVRKQRLAPEPVEAPPPPPPPAKRVYCKNCSAPYDFAKVPEDDARFQCTFCNQQQSLPEAKRSSGYGWHGGAW